MGWSIVFKCINSSGLTQKNVDERYRNPYLKDRDIFVLWLTIDQTTYPGDFASISLLVCWLRCCLLLVCRNSNNWGNEDVINSCHIKTQQNWEAIRFIWNWDVKTMASSDLIDITSSASECTMQASQSMILERVSHSSH